MFLYDSALYSFIFFPVYCYCAAFTIIQSAKKLYQGAFSRTVIAHDGYFFALTDFEADMIHRIVFRFKIGKGNIVKDYLRRLSLHRRQTGIGFDFGFIIQYRS